jgi:ABC-2 type transport system permease protein
MSGTTAAAIRGAFRQARIELRIQLFSWNALSWVMFPAIGLLVMYFLRDREVMGTEVSLAQLGIPGILAMSMISTGVLGVAGQLLTERDDGTLLRAKAVPNGMLGYLMGNVIVYTGTSLGPVLGLLVAAGVFFDGVTPPSAAGWFTFAWVSVLGLFATLPIGAVFGALMRSPVTLGWASMIIYGGMAISGIFYPLGALPGWLQVIGQVLPTYWLGLGLRSALLPAEAVALEVGGSWHTVETVAALGLWTAVGLVLAPIALRRMARHQSGSQVAAARERVMSRGY